MSKVATKLETVSAASAYQAYAKRIIESNMDLRGMSFANITNGKIVHEDDTEYMTYKKYKKIISLFNIKAGVKLIHGYHVHIAPLGYLFIAIFKRNPNKPRLNRGESFKLRAKFIAEGVELTKDNWKVYYTDDDYIKLTWHRQSATRNIQWYKFSPASGQVGKGFRQAMSREVASNPILKALYPFISKTKTT